MKKIFVKRPYKLLLFTLCFLIIDSSMAGEEGGYVGQQGQGHNTVVYNFLKHFAYEQYYWDRDWLYSTSNNSYVDNMDIAVFGGHGNQWLVGCEDGSTAYFSSCGNNSNAGWGNTDLEFIAFESCEVVPRPCDRADGDWWTNWTKTGAAMDGVHQIIGFGTDSYQSTDQDVTDFFGDRINRGYAVWQSWFDAINAEARDIEKGSAVMYPACENDTYYSYVADPPANHTSLRIWYQTGYCLNK
jgi:Family of unknown function (DUF6345)